LGAAALVSLLAGKRRRSGGGPPHGELQLVEENPSVGLDGREVAGFGLSTVSRKGRRRAVVGRRAAAAIGDELVWAEGRGSKRMAWRTHLQVRQAGSSIELGRRRRVVAGGSVRRWWRDLRPEEESQRADEHRGTLVMPWAWSA
jgi:hypothetical protein